MRSPTATLFAAADDLNSGTRESAGRSGDLPSRAALWTFCETTAQYPGRTRKTNERAGEVNVTASAVVVAVRAYSKINERASGLIELSRSASMTFSTQ
jgi:hypothetical protein